jgi:enamine deaminase RidA (YjgF/YER057c/UK114 family)
MKAARSALLILVLTSTVSFAQSAKSGAPKHQGSVRFSNPSTLAKPVSNYSQVVEVTGGKMVFIAGQVGIDVRGKLTGNDFQSQAEQVFKNLKAAVESAGGSFADVVKINYFVSESVDPAQYSAIREIRDRYVSPEQPPASTFVVVKRLVRPEYLLEVEAVAALKN